MRDGRSTGLGWPPLVGSAQQWTEQWCRRQGGSLIGDAAGEERVGKTFMRRYGRWFECWKKNRESDGALDFDGFCRMGGCNNQPKVGRNDAINFWETARSAMTIGEAAAVSFGPSNYWTKKKKNLAMCMLLFFIAIHILRRAICVQYVCIAMQWILFF